MCLVFWCVSFRILLLIRLLNRIILVDCRVCIVLSVRFFVLFGFVLISVIFFDLVFFVFFKSGFSKLVLDVDFFENVKLLKCF